MDPAARKDLYLHVESFDTGRLRVSDVHTIYYEQSGNPGGHPVVFLHGGPGAGTSPGNCRFFDPEFYRIVLFDQRGAGKSTPHACLEENTTWDLVADIEKVGQHLDILEWQDELQRDNLERKNFEDKIKENQEKIIVYLILVGMVGSIGRSLFGSDQLTFVAG